jgi:hypothetical protein
MMATQLDSGRSGRWITIIRGACHCIGLGEIQVRQGVLIRVELVECHLAGRLMVAALPDLEEQVPLFKRDR